VSGLRIARIETRRANGREKAGRFDAIRLFCAWKAARMDLVSEQQTDEKSA
jgi:hypothetical protein